MMEWTTSNPHWEKRIVEGRSLIPCQPLFPDEAEAALDEFKALRVVDAPGSPTFGETGDDWIFDFVRAIFGAYDAEAGTRRINQFFLCVSKKNGKSTIAAGIMLTALIRNWRKSNELIIVAPTIKAANNSFKPAADMVRADPLLNSSDGGFLHVIDHQRTIKHLTTGATLTILAADAGTVAGNKAAFVLVDELWEFGKQSKADAMMREAAGGLVARPEGFLIYITTQADQPPSGVFKDKLDYARDVRDGKIEDPKFMPVIYEFPQPMLDAESYLDPANCFITNPYLGRTAWGPEWIADELKKEMAKGPETRNVFLAKHLNVEIGMNLRANRWPGADFWASRADKTLTYETLMDRSDVVVIGVDGGGLDDLFGLCLLGRDKKTKDWLAWGRAWCHKGVLERRKSIASRLRDFEREGSLTILDDELGDIAAIVEIAQDVKDRKLLASVAADPAGLGEMIDALAEVGITPENGLVIGAPQGGFLMNAIKTAERKLVNGTLWHDGSALMAWCVGNLKIEATATTIRATKANAGDAKIDPAMALFDAVTVMSRNPEAAREPEYQFFTVG
ncbi:terminase large subunit [Paracoccus onubensis]|uniref:terminase large subunit n=1 Tax=Paracoccus onubensis TaxID=1675788 RepID=UPI00273202AF|nr:terminase large subunit [Paracoccus onubensis]MDP0925712.1 terminase large subunit [Paracoccus onubensis]